MMPELIDPGHIFSLRVYYEDTDAGGMVYYANYLRFAERARTEYLRKLGTNHEYLMKNDGIAFTVKECLIEYIRPAFLDEPLEVYTRFTEVRGASILVKQLVKRQVEEVACLKVRLACVDIDGKPKRIPWALRKAFTVDTSETKIKRKQ